VMGLPNPLEAKLQSLQLKPYPQRFRKDLGFQYRAAEVQHLRIE
jgi:hypothetical protein